METLNMQWYELQIECRKAIINFNSMKWNNCKFQLLKMGMPEDSVKFVMSIPEQYRCRLSIMKKPWL